MNDIRTIHLWAPRFDGFGGGITAFSRELFHALTAMNRTVTQCAMQEGSATANGILRTISFASRVLAVAAMRRPDVIISTHINFAPAAHIARRLFGTKYVLVAHGIDVHANLPRFRLKALRAADAVWAVSRWTARRLADIGVNPSKISVIGNTVDADRFNVAAASSALRERYHLAPEEKVILTVARLSAAEGYKGYDSVIRTLPRVRASVGPVRYLIAGDGDDRSRILELAESHGVGSAVTLCGFVRDEELADHYRLADVFAMPSRGEGFGIVFLEAMACGIPVVGGNADGTSDALDDGSLGSLVDPADEGMIAEALVRTLSLGNAGALTQRTDLRARMLALHGRPAFEGRIADALERLT